MLKRLPPPGSVPQASPERGRGDPMLTDRERPDPLRRRQGREKILDRLPVGLDGRHRRRQLGQQGLHQPGLGSHHVGRHRQLRLLEDGPELLGPGLAQPMGARPPLPLALRKAGHGGRRGIGLQELPRQGRRQLGHLQGPGIVRLGLNR